MIFTKILNLAKNTRNIYLLSLVVFYLLLFVIPNSFVSLDFGNTILTVSAFLFGILAGFFIVVTTTDYNSIKSILAVETAGWISLYLNTLCCNKKTARTLARLIDAYVIRAFDYEIFEYVRHTGPEFIEAQRLIERMSNKDKESNVYQNIRSNMDQIIGARQQLTVLGTKTMSLFQWSILISLAIIFIFSLYGLRTGAIFFDIVTVFISASIVTVLLLIRDLDLYAWNDQTFSYEIFENVFKVIGALPYYPEESINERKFTPLENKYRVGTLASGAKVERRKIKIYQQ